MKKWQIATLLVVSGLLVTGCKSDQEKETEKTTVSTSQVTETASSENGETTDGYVLKQQYGAPHGDKSFSVTSVILEGDKIVAVDLDEFQFVSADDFTGVPNSDQTFGKENFPEGLVLASKSENDDAYSAMMKEKGGATQKLSVSMKAVGDYAVGKTVSELEKAISENENMTDVVTGATLSDTTGYIQAIVDTAKDGMSIPGTEIQDGDVTLNMMLGAPHGDKSFSITTVAKVGDKIVASFLDEFQYVSADGFKGVPNSDQTFGKENFPDGLVLASKAENNEAYSKMMAEKGGATQELSVSMDAIFQYVNGKTVSEIEKDTTSNENMADVITGATLSDTTGYVKAIVEAAK